MHHQKLDRFTSPSCEYLNSMLPAANKAMLWVLHSGIKQNNSKDHYCSSINLLFTSSKNHARKTNINLYRFKDCYFVVKKKHSTWPNAEDEVWKRRKVPPKRSPWDEEERRDVRRKITFMKLWQHIEWYDPTDVSCNQIRSRLSRFVNQSRRLRIFFVKWMFFSS